MKIDISNEVELKNGKGNPFGWSQYEIHYKDEMIGFLESGEPCCFVDGYFFELKKIDEKTILCVICKDEQK